MPSFVFPDLPENPLVSCICPTMPGREEFLQIALQCYDEQTYPYRELIILNGNYLYPRVNVRSLTGFVWTRPLGTECTLGGKRNAAVRMANGQIIIHWDDDDWSSPNRILDQVHALLTYGKAVFGYRTMDFLDLTTGQWHHIGKNRSDIEPFGTSLCYLRSWAVEHPFPRIQVGEDVEFIREAARQLQVFAEHGGHMMYATAHPGNTSPRKNMARFPRVPAEVWPNAPHLSLIDSAA